MTRFSLTVAACLLITNSLAGQVAVPNAIFAYELGKKTPAEQAELLAANHFSGTVFDGPMQVPERLAALEAQHLQLFALWLTVDVSHEPYVLEPGSEDAIGALAGRNTMIWLAIKGGGEGAETRAVAASRRVADLASGVGLRVALYPHYGFYLPRFADVLRVAEAADRSNLGVVFNLCHEIRSGWNPKVLDVASRAMPRLYGVTINGAAKDGRDWNTLIQPLGRGNFDVGAVVQTLVKAGYRGPIGVQCYGITEEPARFLPESRLAWQAISSGAVTGIKQ